MPHGLAVARRRLGEERDSAGRGVDDRLQPGIQLGLAALVRVHAAALRRSALERREPGRVHPALGGETLDVVDVDPRPDAARLPRRPALPAPVVVDRLRDRVDPPEAQCLEYRVGPCEAAIGHVRPAQLHPQLRRGVVMPLEPRAELGGVAEEPGRSLGAAGRGAGLVVVAHAISLPPATDIAAIPRRSALPRSQRRDLLRGIADLRRNAADEGCIGISEPGVPGRR